MVPNSLTATEGRHDFFMIFISERARPRRRKIVPAGPVTIDSGASDSSLLSVAI